MYGHGADKFQYAMRAIRYKESRTGMKSLMMFQYAMRAIRYKVVDQ